MQLTKKQWEEIETELTYPWGRVKLKIDGYIVSLVHTLYKDILSPKIMIYVNGKWDHNWVFPKTPEDKSICKRFLHPSKRCSYRATQSNIKKYGKRFVKEMKEKYTGTIYMPYWSSFSSLKKHLIANNKDFEIIDSEEVEVKR